MAANPNAANEIRSAARARARPRVLIVDDVASNLLILEAILSQDYDLLVSMTGEEALRIAAEKLPDLIGMYENNSGARCASSKITWSVPN